MCSQAIYAGTQMYSSPDVGNTNLKMIYTPLRAVHPSPAQKVLLWHNTGIISYINPLIALEIHWKIDEDFGRWHGLEWILWISAKNCQEGQNRHRTNSSTSECTGKQRSIHTKYVFLWEYKQQRGWEMLRKDNKVTKSLGEPVLNPVTFIWLCTCTILTMVFPQQPPAVHRRLEWSRKNVVTGPTADIKMSLQTYTSLGMWIFSNKHSFSYRKYV